MTPMILAVRDLTKTYPGVRAVDGISFEITEATCFGLLGPNGAGKTTTVEMIEGVTEPTSGEVLFRGRPRDRSFREKIGIQFQKTALPDYLKVRDVLQLFSALYRQSLPTDEVVRLCSLEELMGRARPPRSRAASSNGCWWRSRSSTTPRSSSSTSRPPASIRRRATASGTWCAPSARAARPWCSPPTTWRRPPSCATRSPSSIAAR